MGWCCSAGQSGANVPGVSAIISNIPNSKLLTDVGAELSFQLPMQESGTFPAVLAQV